MFAFLAEKSSRMLRRPAWSSVIIWATPELCTCIRSGIPFASLEIHLPQFVSTLGAAYGVWENRIRGKDLIVLVIFYLSSDQQIQSYWTVLIERVHLFHYFLAEGSTQVQRARFSTGNFYKHSQIQHFLFLIAAFAVFGVFSTIIATGSNNKMMPWKLNAQGMDFDDGRWGR